MGEILHESFLFGGWVAMWRPLETFLYEWWSIRAEEKLLERLAAMPVHVAYRQDSKSRSIRSGRPEKTRESAHLLSNAVSES